MSRAIRHGVVGKAIGSIGFVLLVGACGPSLDQGEWGRFRFIGQVKGRAPLAVVPPISDRTGNIYTLYGDISLPEVTAFVSRSTGGSTESCRITLGDVYGAHGWVGFADDRAWYWSGDALVEVSAAGPCKAVLSTDPQTAAQLAFKAVMPWVHVETARTSLVALVQSPGDRLPFSMLVDLDRGIGTNVAALPGEGSLTVLGVGAKPQSSERVALVARTTETTTMEALFFDDEANLVDRVPVQGAPPPEYGVRGTLQFGPNGTVVGLTSLDSLVVFDRSGGTTIALGPQMTPVGVHRYDDALWLVGTAADAPVVSALDERGRPGPHTRWAASDEARASLDGPRQVTDDRSYPARDTTWPDVRNGMGPAPFLTPHSPWPHAPGTTLWCVAGPVLGDESSPRPRTSIAIAPVGIRYP